MCVDAETLPEMFSLVERISQHDSDADAIADRLLRIYRRFPPSERHLQAVSLLQQRWSGSGGREEYVTTTLCGVSMLAIATL